MLAPVSCALLSFSQAYGPERQSIASLFLQIRFMSFWLINRNGPILLTLTLESVWLLPRSRIASVSAAAGIVMVAAVPAHAHARAAGPRSAIRQSGSAAPP